MADVECRLQVTALPGTIALEEQRAWDEHKGLHEALLRLVSRVLRRPAYKGVLQYWEYTRRGVCGAGNTPKDGPVFQWQWQAQEGEYLAHILPRTLAGWWDDIEELLAQSGLQTVSPRPDTTALLKEKPAPYHFAELDNALHTIEVYEGSVETLRIRRVASPSFALCYRSFASFGKQDQGRILAAMNEAVCGCDLCVFLRRRASKVKVLEVAQTAGEG